MLGPCARIPRRPRRIARAAWRVRALVYHRSSDGAPTDNSTRSAAAPGRSRPQDAALLVAGRRCSRSVGGALSLAFALTRARNYQSWPSLFYQERIQSSLLSEPRGGRAAQHRRSLSRAPARARRSSSQIIGDPKLNPFPTIKDPSSRSTSCARRSGSRRAARTTFRITYTDSDPDRAKAVTDKLTKLLQDKDEALRNEQAPTTVAFATKQKDEAADRAAQARAGARRVPREAPRVRAGHQPAQRRRGRVRSARSATQKPNADRQHRGSYALERQRQRIQARLDAPPDAPPIRVPSPPTPEKIAAEAAVDEAQRELAAANRELEDALSKYTDKHPTVIKAQERVAAAQQRLRHAPGRGAARSSRRRSRRRRPPIARSSRRSSASSRRRSPTSRSAGKGGDRTPPADASDELGRPARDPARRPAARGQRAARARRRSPTACSARRSTPARSSPSRAAAARSSTRRSSRSRPSGPGKTIFLLAGMVLFLGARRCARDRARRHRRSAVPPRRHRPARHRGARRDPAADSRRARARGQARREPA